jgi:hypothetical protein
MEHPDHYWTVAKPRNGSARAIEEMNAKMMAFHPALHATRREDHQVLHDAHNVLQEDFSISELFRRTLSQPQ